VHVALRGEIPMARQLLNRLGRRARMARCEQKVWRRTCGPLPFGLRLVANPAALVARSIQYASVLARIGVPPSPQSTRSLRKCRCWRNASASRVVIGTIRIRLPFVVPI